jgi:hypothetical protein
MNQGWECPKCHSVYAPWAEKCWSCRDQAATTTTWLTGDANLLRGRSFVPGPQGTEGTVWNGATWITYT